MKSPDLKFNPYDGLVGFAYFHYGTAFSGKPREPSWWDAETKDRLALFEEEKELHGKEE